MEGSISKGLSESSHLLNEASGYEISSLRLPKKWPNLSFTFTPITPTRLYKDKTKNSRRIEVAEFVRVEVFSLRRNCIPSPYPSEGDFKEITLRD